MKLTRNKIGNLCPVLTAALSLALLAGSALGDDESDFEAMIREAMRTSQKNDQDAPKTPAAKAVQEKSTKQTPMKSQANSEEVGRQTKGEPKTSAKAESQAASTFKISRTEKPLPKTVDSGWTAMVPNEPLPNTEPAAAQDVSSDHGAVPLAVADRRMSVAAEAKESQQRRAPARESVSIWDAVPETVDVASEEGEKGATGETKAEKTEPVAASPWDVVLTAESGKTKKSEEKKTADDSPKTTDDDWLSPKTVDPPEDKEEQSDEKAENASEQTASKESDADETKESETAEETAPLLVPPQEDPEESDPKDEADMTAKLRAVEKENQEEAAKKENGKKTESVFGVTESGKIVVKEEKEEEEIKEPLKVDAPVDAQKKADEKDSDAGKEETIDEEDVNVDPNEEASEEEIEMLPEEEEEEEFPDFDDEEDEDAPKRTLIDGSRVGDKHGKDKIKLMYDEIVNGLKMRNMSGRYEMWKNYARGTLRGTAGLNTGSEVDGRCRLSWYTKMYSEPIYSVFDAEEFSRQMHHGLSGNHRRIAETMGMIRNKLDVPARNDEGIKFRPCETPFEALNEVKRCLLEAQMAHGRALSTLSTVEVNELANNLVSTFSGPGCVNGHTIPNRTYGRRLCNIMEKMDKTGIHDAAESLIPLTNKALLRLLAELPEDAFPKVMLGGQKVQRLSTAAGDIIIGGRENNIYDLDAPEMRDVVCVIDLGGNDIFREGTCNIHRPVFVVLTLAGNDTFTGTRPGIQGGSVLGVSMLVSLEGNNSYSASDVAQGSTIGGAGMLFDFGGDGNYKGLRRVQGHALCGIGMLVSQGGNDKFRAALWAQGFGAPGGFGVLENSSGNNYYYCGGLYIDSYPEHPGYDGWGQGIGAGIRQVANGGIGMILSGKGDDVYEVDYFGHGGGYWLGVGIARDFGGNDIRHGTTKSAYNGGPRRESEWTRFANGFGCHYALGFLFDDAGNDVYGGRIMGTGMAWDLSIGYLCDFNGNDRFTATGGMTQGVGAEGSIGILFSYGGNDIFGGRNQAFANSGITYHSPSNCGSNFSFVINYGGNDTYGSGARNNSYVQRGSPGGFLIDRPTEREAAGEIAALKKLIEQREKEIAEFDAVQEKLKAEAAEKGRRYVQRQRRPQPIPAAQSQILGAVPDFNSAPARTGASDVNVK